MAKKARTFQKTRHIVTMMIYGCDSMTSAARCKEVAKWLEKQAKFIRNPKSNCSSQMRFTLQLKAKQWDND